VLVNNSGTVNFSAAGDISADGTVNLTALGGIQTAGDITTTNDSVTLVSATTLTGAVTINTGSGVGDITFNGTVNGSEDLTLAAGTGNIDFNQSVGQTARLDQLRIVSLTDATFDAAVSVQNFLQNAGSDTTTFTGRLNTNTAAGINVTGTNLVFNGGITTTNAGPVTASLSATALIGPSTTSSISGPVTINSVGSITVASSASVAVSNTVLLKTTADSITFQDSAQLTGSSGNVVLEAEDNISLAGGSTIAVTSGELILRSGLSSTDGVGSMTLDGTLHAVTAGQTITLDLNDELAATQNMTTGRILAPYLRLLSNGTNAATFTLLAGTRNDVDTLAVSTSGAVSYSDADDLIIGAIATSSGIASIAGISTLNGVSEGAVVSITANNAMTVNQNIRTSPVAGPGGLNIGTVTLSSTVSTISITDNGDIYADGAVSMTAPSGIQTAGEVTTSDDNVTFNSAVTLIGAVAIDTEFGAGTITFNATVNGSEDLTLTAGTGNIDFNQSVGQTARLDQLRIVSVTDATFDAAVSAQNVLQDAGTGTTTFVGLLDTTIPAGVNLTGTNLHVVTGINTVGTGVVTVNLAGITPGGVAEFDNNADIFADGAVTVTTTTRISTGGDVTTTNDNVTITALTVVLTQSITVDSGPGLGNILLDAGIEGTTANSQSLILDAGTGGTLTITGSIGKATALNTFTLVDSNGAEIGTLDTDYIVADTLVHIVSSEAGALVRFNGGVKTPQVNADEAGYHLQFAGSGTNVGTDMSSDYLSAILRNTGEAIFGDGNNDILLFRNGVEVFAASSVEMYGSIYTHAAPVTLGDGDTPTNLRIHRSIIDTTSAGLYPMGDTITFGGVLEGGTALGNENVDLDAGTSGDIVYMDEVGGARRIGTMLIRSARNIDFPNVTAQSVLQTTGTGTNTVSGIMNTTSASGVNITTTNIVVNNLVTTIVDPLMTDSAPGIVNLQATAGTASATTGIITMLDPGRIVSSNDVTIAGNRNVQPAILVYEATPAGPDLTPQTRDFITTTTLGADVLIESSISFISPGETANNDFTINTKAANGNITLQGAIDGNWNNFVLISGTGTVATTATAPMTEVATLTLQDNSGFSNGTINLNASIAIDWIEVFPQNYAVNILGSSNTVGVRSYYKYGNTQHPIFHNTGGVRFGDDATDYIWFRERLTSVASTTTVTGVIEANFTIAFGNVIVSNTASLISTGGGDVNITGNISGPGATLRFGENTDGTMNYRITGNVTLGTLTTFADDTSITFLEDVTLETPTTLLNQRIQLGDAADDITSVAGIFDASAVSLLSLGGTVVT
ncbi:MAG: beta strand repeat-containing protein, partial [Planctomyces sp.]